MMIPALASLERPMLRIRLANTLESTVPLPPITMTQVAYCRAYWKVFSPAPNIFRTGSMNTPIPTANSAEISRPK